MFFFWKVFSIFYIGWGYLLGLRFELELWFVGVFRFSKCREGFIVVFFSKGIFFIFILSMLLILDSNDNEY